MGVGGMVKQGLDADISSEYISYMHDTFPRLCAWMEEKRREAATLELIDNAGVPALLAVGSEPWGRVGGRVLLQPDEPSAPVRRRRRRSLLASGRLQQSLRREHRRRI